MYCKKVFPRHKKCSNIDKVISYKRYMYKNENFFTNQFVDSDHESK